MTDDKDVVRVLQDRDADAAVDAPAPVDTNATDTVDAVETEAEADVVPPPPAATGNCLNLQEGIAAANACKIAGDNNKCPAGSAINYGGQRQTLDAYLKCPLDSVGQSDWQEASQKGLCQCEASLLDTETCGIIEATMDCECSACPFGMAVGFAYSCTTEIVGPCKSFDCFGKCNGKYDPGNLLGRETFAPSILGTTPTTTAVASGAGMSSMNTMVLMVALFQMIVL
mmetsp:Transcript_25607/g.28673  ORF Transcript_25607/g.28673 Transcript_25607/m.28673 type:complete len:227 (-) Transcript_25607:321-1001(-)